jgi:hypothetical protein
MAWDVTDKDFSLELENTATGYKAVYPKSQLSILLETPNILKITSAAVPYKELCSWNENDITSLTGATTIANGYAILLAFMETDVAP